MSWTVSKEPSEHRDTDGKTWTEVRIHVRAIIDIDNEQAELKDLIASLQKHVKEG